MDLVITGIGMLCSVGHDAVAACAAIRAGLNRRRPIDYYQVFDPDTLDTTPTIGCPVHGYTEGFGLLGRWIRLAMGCLEDLSQYGHLPEKSDKVFWSSTGLIGVTCPMDDGRIDSDEDLTPDDVKQAYLYRLLDVLGYPVLPDNLGIVCTGHSGAIAAIGQARSMLENRALERVIVLGVDSYLDPITLDWLDQHHRLRTAQNSTGLTPGEAGACFMLETAASGQNRHARAQALVSEPALGQEANHCFADEPSQGMTLAAVMSEALRKGSVTLPFAGDVISDFNGEPWRAHEMGAARARLAEVLGPDARYVFPCDSLADVGAASGAVAICVAVRALQRGYSRQNNILVATSAEYGQVGAVAIAGI